MTTTTVITQGGPITVKYYARESERQPHPIIQVQMPWRLVNLHLDEAEELAKVLSQVAKHTWVKS